MWVVFRRLGLACPRKLRLINVESSPDVRFAELDRSQLIFLPRVVGFRSLLQRTGDGSSGDTALGLWPMLR